MQNFQFTYWDISIFVIYLGLILWRGIKYKDQHEKSEDFFLAGRSLAWPLVGLSLFASNISSSSIIGMAGSGYKTGISVFNYEWMGSILLVFFAVFIVSGYLNSKLFTMPEFLERRFDSRARFYFAGITIIANIVIDTAGSLYAGAIVFRSIFPEVSITAFIVTMAFLAGAYTIAGGLRAVVFTDAIQSILMTIGSIIIAILIFNKLGSFEAVWNQISVEKLHLFQPADDKFLPWPTIIISLPILSFYYWCTNQLMVQRVLGARSIEDGKKGAIFAGFLKLPLLFIMVLPGTAAILLYPDLDQPNLVFPNLMFDLLPTGVLGLVFTGFIAALMSSIDSALNSASTQATIDYYQKITGTTSDQKLIRVGRIFTFMFVVFAALWAPIIHTFPTLWEYLQAVLSYLIPPVVVCFIFGLFWKRATADGAIYSLVGGNIAAALLLVVNYFDIWYVHYLYSASIIFAISCLVIVVKSLLTPDTELDFETHKQWIDTNFSFKAVIPDRSNWFAHSSFYALLLILTTAVIVYIFA